MDQGRVWLAIVLSLGLFFAYDYFVIRPYREAQRQHASTSTLPAPEAPAVSGVPPVVQETPGAPALDTTRVVQSAGGKQTIVWIAAGVPTPVRIVQREDGSEVFRLQLTSWR